ncbi:MAG: hypothetical protein JSS10_08920 [Verrucomicrobia bacterium]|nr:hypothetical protein [Verrucomicrobiota bacterium]
MVKQRSRPLTLLEIVIVLALIGLLAGWGASSLTDLLAQHRRQAEIDELKNLFQELQIEALALQTDFEVTFSLSKEVAKVQSKTSEKILRNRIVELKGVKTLSWNHQSKDQLVFQILSNGRVEPPGIIEFQRRKDHFWMDLRQPLQIKFSDQRPAPLNEVIPDKPKKKEYKQLLQN